jgi:hypothetical protein
MVIALFADHDNAEEAIRTLHRAGFDMTRLSIIGRDYQTEEQVLGFVSDGDRVKYWGKHGALWGGLWGLFVGSAMLLFPGVGHLIVLGPFASALLNLAGGAAAGGGIGALSAALLSIGLPRDAVVKYRAAIRAGQFAVIAHGSEDDVKKAKSLLQAAAPEELDEHLPMPLTA